MGSVFKLWGNFKCKDTSHNFVAADNTFKFTWFISVILSEFGAFSGGGGETRIIERVQNNYIYVLQNGTKVESAEPREDLKVHEVITTTTTTSAPPPATSEQPGYEGSAVADDDFWEADYTEDTGK